MSNIYKITVDDFSRKTERIHDWQHRILINGNIVNKEEYPKFKQQIVDSLKALDDVKKYGFKDVEDIVTILSNERAKIIGFELREKSLKQFLMKRISEIQHRLETWNNFTTSGNAGYSSLSLRLDTYKEILSEITGDMT